MSSDLPQGARLGRYEINSQLGAGGMGEVYLAQDTKLDRKVALKILPADVAAHPNRMKRFVQEAKSASALNHPNIITIHEIEQTDSVHFIATEFIDGQTLREHLQSARMKLGEVLDVAAQIASALSAAHAAGIVHRDVKPENVMLRRDGIVKVLDFGLAKLTERVPLELVNTEAPTRAVIKTESGVVVGTTIYMSPEQARGLAVDARTDIFSLGVLSYEMVAGRLPFEGSNTNEILASILSDKEPPPLARYSRDVPFELERIVSKALRKDKEERYQTAKDMLLDLKSLKQELEFERKLERSVPPESKSEADIGEQAGAETVMESAARRTVSERRLTSAIKLNKRNVDIAVAALLIIASGTVAYFYFTRARSGTINSVAVLPFVNASNNPDAEYLSDGISESLINSLSQLPGVKVIASSSSFKYKGKDADPQEVAKALGVEAILTGKVLQRGDKLLINAELVNARDKTQVWGAQYNRKLADLLVVQEEISREISENLRLKLTGEEKQRLTKRYTQNTEAYQLYLRGVFYRDKLSEDSLKKAVQYFQQAIDADPNYALAYAGLSSAYGPMMFFGFLPIKESRPKMLAAVTKALELDDTLAEAHNESGVFKFFLQRDWSGGESAFRRAIELNANYALAHHMYANLLVDQGRFDEGIAERKRAVEIDPLSLRSNALLGWDYYIAGRYDQALEQYRKTSELDPNYPLIDLGQVYERKGMNDEAVAEYLKDEARSGMPVEKIAALKGAYAASAMRGYWQKRLNLAKEDLKQRPLRPLKMAELSARADDKNQAFEWLEKAYEEGDLGLLSLKIEPVYASLHGDPRFDDLIKQIGLQR